MNHPPAGTAPNRRFIRWLAGLVLVGVVCIGAGAWIWVMRALPHEAPEMERVLAAQASLPFQALIPAYLPGGFFREQVEVRIDGRGPQGEALLQLGYPAWGGGSLVLSEWVPSHAENPPVGGKAAGMRACHCACSSSRQCSANHFMVDVGPLRVMAEFSSPQLISFDQLNAVLTTLGPAANLQVYSRLEDVPVNTAGLPPATSVPLNEKGVQELVLIVASDGYSAPHFAVRKGIPVRLVFRQLGEVGCGNELVFQWGAKEQAELTLSGPGDEQTLEFTPLEAGDFSFHCPHQIFQGVMTVQE